MKIVFCGTHGTGKSTLLYEVLTLTHPHGLGKARIFNGIGRRIHAQKKWTEKNKQRYFDYWYVWNHYWNKNFIGSRSIYDTWAYARLGIGLDFNRRLFNWAIRHINYDFVFYVPIEFPLEKDGIRYEDTEFQILHDRETKMILDYYYIPYHTITGSIYQRISQVRTILNV